MKNCLSKKYLLLNKVLFFIALGLMPFIYSCSKDAPVQTHYSNPNFVAYQCENGGKYGFKDKGTGEQIIECKYNSAMDFTDGLAAVMINLKWGFINSKGEEVIPLKYDRCYPFSDGLAAVRLNNKYGFVDKNGKEVVPLKYENFYSDFSKNVFGYSEGLVAVKLGKWGFIDKEGNIAIQFVYDYAYYFKNGQAQVDRDGWIRCVLKNGEYTPCN